jgi:hypothetical protein
VDQIAPADRRLASLQRELDELPLILRALSAEDAAADQLRIVLDGEIARLRDRVADAVQEPDVWVVLDEIERSSERLSTEALAVVGGITARRAGVGAPLCSLADQLILQLQRRLRLGEPPLTIPSPSEFVDLLSDVIRVRFPGGDVWHLPVVLHELGHFVAHRLGAGSPRGTVVDGIIARELAIKPFRGAFAEELFADCFATYAGGPAYLYTLMLRLSPVDGDDDSKPTHPSPVKRALAVSLVLDHLLGKLPPGPRSSLAPYVQDLAGTWRQALIASGVPPEPSDETTTYVRGLVSEFMEALDAEIPVLRYGPAHRAIDLRVVIRHRDGSDSSDIAPAEGDTMVDVLNAGWFARREAELERRSDRIAAIGDRTARLGERTR